MVLYKSFREELVEQIQDSDPALYASCEKTVDDVLADNKLIDWMWAIYQKDMEDYDMEAPEAFRDALERTLGIPAAA